MYGFDRLARPTAFGLTVGLVARLRPATAAVQDALMETPDTYYAVTRDGAYIAYQVIGDGPIDVVSQLDWPGNIDMELDDPLARVWYPPSWPPSLG